MCRQEHTCIQFDKEKCALDKRGHNRSVFPGEINGEIHRQKRVTEIPRYFSRLLYPSHGYPS